MALDVTECPVHQPLDYEEQKKFYSGKAGTHTVKYELAVEVHTGLLVWFQGPYYGATHDLTIVRQSGILDFLLPSEFILADKAYVGEHKLVTAFKNPSTPDEHAINSIFYAQRTIVENSFQRFKSFQFTQQHWRHGIELHFIAMKALAQIVNIDIYFRPLRQ
jgi:hypothetical protein